MAPRMLATLLALSALPSAVAQVTFTKDVAPILYRSCVGCHRPGDIAPMSLLSYKEARPWAASIRESVTKRTMPPWHADPRYGHFSNDPRLSDAEIATIQAWAKTGAKEGDPKDLPPVPRFNNDWSIGKPDAVIDIGQDFTVLPAAPDRYVQFVVETNFTEDKWVRAVELRPSNRKVVHHAHVYLTEDPEKKKSRRKDAASSFMYQADGMGHMRPDAPVHDDGCAVPDAGNQWGRREGQDGILGSYLPGKSADAYPEHTAKLIPKGTKLTFNIHYARIAGKPETDRSMVGLVFAPEPPARPLRRMDVSNYLFRIPPGAASHPVRECHTFDKDVELLSLTAHMHYRGKAMRFDLERADGRRETLLDVPAYSFAWQQVYRLKEPVTVNRGDRLVITALFDNSANNKWNPDATKVIRWGAPSEEEMMDGWLEYLDAKPPATPHAAPTGSR